MVEFEFALTIRNLLLIQLLMIAMLPQYAVAVHRELKKIWKTINTPLIPGKKEKDPKKSKFWEIDMTKFEP